MQLHFFLRHVFQLAKPSITADMMTSILSVRQRRIIFYMYRPTGSNNVRNCNKSHKA